MLNYFKKNTSDYTDSELVERYKKSGDLYYLGILFERYAELVYGVCLKVLKNETDAEDAYMGIFEKLAQKAKEHPIQSFRPWLYVLARNHCLEILRKKKETFNSFL